MRLLCVEDDRVNALLLQHSCLAAGVSALEFAETGTDALTLASGFDPDLLVLDLHLPDTDGFALLAALRSAVGAPTLPAVLCTAESPAEVGARAAAAGFLCVWPKPVAAEQVRATLAELAAQAPSAQARSSSAAS